MDKNKSIKALGAGAVAIFLVAGVALGADAIFKAPTPAGTVVLTAEETQAPAATLEPTGTPEAAETAEPGETAEPAETQEPAGTAEPKAPAKAAPGTPEANDDNGGQTGHDDGDANDDHDGQSGHEDGDANDDNGGQSGHDGDDDNGGDD